MTQQQTNVWPFLVFVFVCFFINPVFAIFIGNLGPPAMPWLAIFLGLLIGQQVIVGGIAGLFSRHWVIGFVIATILNVVGIHITIAIAFQSFDVGPMELPKILIGAGCIPGAMFVAGLPALAMRLFWGWRISSSQEPLSSIRIEDYLITMAILGSSIALCRAAFMIWQTEQIRGDSLEIYVFFPGTFYLYCGVYLFVINLLALPAIRFAFARDFYLTRVVTIAVYSVFLWIGAIFVIATIGGFAGNRFAEEILFGLLGAIVTAALTTAVGFGLLQYSGVQLRRKRDDHTTVQRIDVISSNSEKGKEIESETPAPVAIDPFSDDAEINVEPKRQPRDWVRYYARVIAFAMVIFTMIISIYATLDRNEIAPHKIDAFEQSQRAGVDLRVK